MHVIEYQSGFFYREAVFTILADVNSLGFLSMKHTRLIDSVCPVWAYGNFKPFVNTSQG